MSAGSAAPYSFVFEAAVTVIAWRPTVTVVAADERARWLVPAAFVTVTVQVVPLPPVVVSVVAETEQPALPASVTAYDTAPSPEPPDMVSVSGTP